MSYSLGAHTFHRAWVEVRGQRSEVRPGSQTQGTRLGGRCLYQLSHLSTFSLDVKAPFHICQMSYIMPKHNPMQSVYLQLDKSKK